MAKRTTPKVWQIDIETGIAPVSYRSDACRLADESWLPMTVYATSDPDMRWCIVEATNPRPVAPPYSALPIVTILPNRYFVR